MSPNRRADERMRFEPTITGIRQPKRYGRQNHGASVENMVINVGENPKYTMTNKSSNLLPVSFAYG